MTQTKKTQQTRERILEAALKCFNQEGLESTSTRQIAAEAGISQGNLCYHFPDKAGLVEALYQQLWQAFDKTMGAKREPLTLARQPLATWMILKTQYRYRFLMLNFVQVMRAYPEIRKHFQAAVPRRLAQFAALFTYYRSQGWMLPEMRPGQDQQLVMQAYILGDFWMAEAEILFSGTEDQLLLHYTKMLCNQYWPYLTPAGQDLLTQALNNLPTDPKTLARA